MSSVGSAVVSLTAIAGSASGAVTAYSLIIQPTVGQEWSIHNMYYGGTCNIQKTDGTNYLAFYSPTGPGGLTSIFISITNAEYLAITNTGTSGTLFGYDGVRTV